MSTATGLGALLLCSAFSVIVVGLGVLLLAMRDDRERICKRPLESLGRCVDRARSFRS